MRAVPAALAATIESGAAPLCTCWVLTRGDGARLGFTDHDRPLTLTFAAAAVTCEAASGWTLGAADGELGLSPGTATATGALDSAALDSGALAEADIARGLYDGAAVEAWRVDWSAPASRILLWRGTITRMAREGPGFTAEVEGPLGVLKRVAGRTYGRTCDARLGDARCRVDLTRAEVVGQTCDQRWATCRDRFANAVNFQGFPDIPGDDYLAAVPTAGERNDGRSRR